MRGAVETKRVLAKRKLAEVGSILSGWRCFGDAGGPSYRAKLFGSCHVVEAGPAPACPRSCDGTLLCGRSKRRRRAHTLGPVSHGQFQ